MDGTLTIPVHDFELIRSHLGIPSGVPILEAINKMPQDEARQTASALHDMEMELALLATPQPDAVMVLDALLEKGKKLAILTRNDEDIGRATLKAAGLDHYFPDEVIIGRETCAPKPLPDGVNHLLMLWGADRSDTVIVGDYLYDIQAGFEAGIHTVHFDFQGIFAWPEYTHHRVTRLQDIAQLY